MARINMKRFLIFLLLCVATNLGAEKRREDKNQQQPPLNQHEPGKGDERISGTIQIVSTATAKPGATVTIHSGSGNIPYTVVLTDVTVITVQGKPSTLADVKKQRKLDCTGAFHDEKFEATSCILK
jgi:hypothetical protein